MSINNDGYCPTPQHLDKEKFGMIVQKKANGLSKNRNK
jgi:hypothetical protein